MKAKYLLIIGAILFGTTACVKEQLKENAQKEDVWEIVISSGDEELTASTKGGNLTKTLILNHLDPDNDRITATLKKNGTTYKDPVKWEITDKETDVYKLKTENNIGSLEPLKKGGNPDNLEVKAKVDDIYRGGTVYVNVVVKGDVTFTAPSTLFKKGYTCMFNKQDSEARNYDYRSSGEIKVLEYRGTNNTVDITNDCSNWTTTVPGASASTGKITASTSTGSGYVQFSYEGETYTTGQITVKERKCEISVPKTEINANGENLPLTYNMEGYEGLILQAFNPDHQKVSWVRLDGGPITEGSGQINLVFSKNDTYTNRTVECYLAPRDNDNVYRDYLYINGKTFTQPSTGGDMTLSDYEISFFKNADSYTVNVSGVDSGQPWSASSNQSWCTLSKTSSSGPGSVVVSVAKNDTGNPREATVTFNTMGKNTTLKVTQSNKGDEPLTITASAVLNGGGISPTAGSTVVTLTIKNENNSSVTISNISYNGVFHKYGEADATITSLADRATQLNKTTYAAKEENVITFGHGQTNGGQLTYSYKWSGKTYTQVVTW